MPTGVDIDVEPYRQMERCDSMDRTVRRLAGPDSLEAVMSASDLELTRRGYGAFAENDLDTLREIIAEDATWHVAGNNQIAKTYHGIDEIFGFFAKLGELTQGTLRQDIHDILANDDHVVALLNVSAERDDMRMEDHQIHVLHIDNGKLTSFWGVPEDQAGWDRFYGQASTSSATEG